MIVLLVECKQMTALQARELQSKIEALVLKEIHEPSYVHALQDNFDGREYFGPATDALKLLKK